MPKHDYSIDVNEEECAKAMGKELHVSPKDSVEICKEIKDMYLEDAQEYLEAVVRKEKSVPYSRHDKKKAHRKGAGQDSGGYPVKAANAILDVLENVEANAEYKGLVLENLRIIHASAKKGIEFPGIQPRAFGRATPSNRMTSNIEIVVREEG
ncbi:hypothetical protein AKJ41_02950 [candidate division MSBL1 archaeon SCGC-AAA259O05]|uniref:Large ribosomal subunit protein uL22 n=1 Tax=candidate division MSBL1 archaeon SCGC-AAA259O05 TaxID=1698271 RepID=A0A133V3M8_9EURY|nr:hypothetical protein AKJ41_02950 [candidate division MSBL1 archaeon SCGC-AAA259O05]